MTTNTTRTDATGAAGTDSTGPALLVAYADLRAEKRWLQCERCGRKPDYAIAEKGHVCRFCKAEQPSPATRGEPTIKEYLTVAGEELDVEAELPPKHDELTAYWECDSCGGRGHDGEAHWQGHFQPPEPFPCGDCGGSGRVPVVAYTAEQVQEAIRADRTRRAATCTPAKSAPGKVEKAPELPPLYAQALDLVHKAEYASVSMVQRRLRIGWNAARDLIVLMRDRNEIPDAWLPPAVADDCTRLADLAAAVAEHRDAGIPQQAVASQLRAGYREETKRQREQNAMTERMLPLVYEARGAPAAVREAIGRRCSAGEFDHKKLRAAAKAQKQAPGGGP